MFLFTVVLRFQFMFILILSVFYMQLLLFLGFIFCFPSVSSFPPFPLLWFSLFPIFVLFGLYLHFLNFIPILFRSFPPTLSYTCPYCILQLPFPFLSSSSEEHSVMYLMVPKPLDSFNLLRVKGKGLKQKVLHASCEWYALQIESLSLHCSAGNQQESTFMKPCEQVHHNHPISKASRGSNYVIFYLQNQICCIIKKF